jgi:hypothetical protein
LRLVRRIAEGAPIAANGGGMNPPLREFDREKIIAERMEEELYQQELKVYRDKLEAMLISF